MSEIKRVIDLQVEVEGTPEEVWRAIATGPGISSWYVPHTVEERERGSASASFGPGPEMEVPGRVTAWEPPRRVAFDGGEGVPGLAFEWLVEARTGGTCVVRLINSGFGEGVPWDDQYDAMTEGWGLFLLNLQLHMKHFRGQSAVSMLPMAMWTGSPDEIWSALTNKLGIPERPIVGQRIHAGSTDGPMLAGVVADVGAQRIALLLDEPAPGTAFIAVEGCGVSVWSYLYGEGAGDIVKREESRWAKWLDEHA